MRALFGHLAIAAAVSVFAAFAANAERAVAPNEVAQYLAGYAPPPQSPLAALASELQWQSMSKSFNAGWEGLDRDISKVRAWSSRHLGGRFPVVLYLFSGPDFIYADAFFPHATTYVFTGLERVGEVPDPMALPVSARGDALSCVRVPFDQFQNYGVFKTAELQGASEDCEFRGTVPLLLIALAHAGKMIRAVRYVEIDVSGALRQGAPGGHGDAISGVKIEFEDKARGLRSLYYFSADLSDAAVGAGGFLKFCDQFSDGVSFVKGGSYLLHKPTFSQLRDFVLGHFAAIVQDDTGVPLKYFDADAWRLRPFGDYRTPINPFKAYAQPDVRALFRSAHPSPLNFGFGYHWRPHEANLMVALRNGTSRRVKRTGE
jgi:hypothetical protein